MARIKFKMAANAIAKGGLLLEEDTLNVPIQELDAAIGHYAGKKAKSMKVLPEITPDGAEMQ